jgi:hypothetical protein
MVAERVSHDFYTTNHLSVVNLLIFVNGNLLIFVNGNLLIDVNFLSVKVQWQPLKSSLACSEHNRRCSAACSS